MQNRSRLSVCATYRQKKLVYEPYLIIKNPMVMYRNEDLQVKLLKERLDNEGYVAGPLIPHEKAFTPSGGTNKINYHTFKNSPLKSIR